MPSYLPPHLSQKLNSVTCPWCGFVGAVRAEVLAPRFNAPVQTCNASRCKDPHTQRRRQFVVLLLVELEPVRLVRILGVRRLEGRSLHHYRNALAQFIRSEGPETSEGQGFVREDIVYLVTMEELRRQPWLNHSGPNQIAS